VARKRAKRKVETRRTEGAVIDARAARVIEAVFEATGAELADNGYAALRMEDVAERAGVNKTTVYRRWPTKKDLVVAALKSMTRPAMVVPTGSIERDLLAALKNVVAYATSPAGRAAARVMLGAHNDPEVDKIAAEVRHGIRAEHARIFQRAIDAGQLPKDTSIELLQQIIFMPILMRALIFKEPVDESVMKDIIAVVLEGAKTRRSGSRHA
jgi:AcrR family transcriptional regulator